eukprot:TRINITY_DN65600_c0_g1_i1.p1 TRINITY_DN65600_c0_g1~~TRINITY_DN65600_c0_g1_i1.p1  ORF type:complete len:116 (-),score=15.80 TRINITY_DN65600_c0_g1_i1:125-472(-)
MTEIAKTTTATAGNDQDQDKSRDPSIALRPSAPDLRQPPHKLELPQPQPQQVPETLGSQTNDTQEMPKPHHNPEMSQPKHQTYHSNRRHLKSRRDQLRNQNSLRHSSFQRTHTHN